MIDWLTLRTPVTHFLEGHLFEQFHKFVGVMTVTNGEGEVVRSKPVFDVDMVRSDSQGIYWQISSNGKERYLIVGASPASLEHSNNVFGSDDIKHCSEVILRHASIALGIIVPPPSAWECRRIDITHNYLLDSHDQVKQALRELRQGDGVRQKASVPKGDSVYWGQGSDMIGAKAYDKGAQIEQMLKKKKFTDLTQQQLDISKRLLRLELSLKRRWFDRHTQHYLTFTTAQLNALHTEYFGQFIGRQEVTDMGHLLELLNEVASSKGHALAAHRTWALIKAIGYEQTRSSMPHSTFCRHQKLLKMAGLSHADLQSANVLQFRRKTIDICEPVHSWHELLKAA
jgi:II/X family phage/plasmid replication protein